MGWGSGLQHVRGTFIYLIHSFIPYLLKDFSVTGTVLGTGDRGGNLAFSSAT